MVLPDAEDRTIIRLEKTLERDGRTDGRTDRSTVTITALALRAMRLRCENDCSSGSVEVRACMRGSIAVGTADRECSLLTRSVASVCLSVCLQCCRPNF